MNYPDQLTRRQVNGETCFNARSGTNTSQRILYFTQPKNIFRRLLFSGQATYRKDGI
jgi:hypothetical protein